MTPTKTFRMIPLGDAKRLTKGAIPVNTEFGGQLGSPPMV